jgi:hypothetical protein
LNGHSDARAISRGAKPFPRPFGDDNVRNVAGGFYVLFGGYYAVVYDYEPFLFKPDHDLTVVGFWGGGTALEGVAVGAA